MEAQPFLVGERHHLHGEGQPFVALMKVFDNGNGNQNTEHTVETASVPYGVEMAPEEERRAAVTPGIAADQVADGVLARLHPGGSHPGSNVVLGSSE